MEDIFQSVIRTSLSYLLLTIVTFMFGKQINSHKNHFNFALSITLGSYIANMGFDLKLHFFPMLCSLCTLTFLYFIFLNLSNKSRKLRKWLSGQPVLFIEKGKILEENLRKNRFSLDDLLQRLREQGIFDLHEIEYCFLEVSGNLSVLKKTAFQTITKQDFSINEHKQLAFPLEIILNGQVIQNEKTIPYQGEWIHNECKKRHIHIWDVNYAVIGTNGRVYFDLYADQLK